ncbi:FxsA family protein [Salinisphaera aquimarina]|uniref:FxsA family protein n=1 Tax=Salinisphaera aquimarina TaxID=2094031 RepID=A0ABV7EUA0_9GAMM
MALRLLLLFIVLPIVELMLLIKVGGLIGFLPTIALVIVTAFVGSQLVRRQGLTVLQRIRESQARGETPALPLLDGAALLFAGFMLLTPGFISDAFGFVLLIPGLREKIARRLLSKVVIMQAAPGAGARYAGRGEARSKPSSVIEGDYQRKDGPSDSADDSNDRIGRDDGA